ncbi:DUF6776 family protein [Pleionea litopenaei]|uniref:Uncharacterized protein n=1 Tax=Pleionea litopenaei TaxID=3070815 RepID=A0AA51RX03_9GAMM|nr:DUF6776 family protein [Pleionea sp. HL-JVS1]WMS89130.1 hypothetical protein Q9312_09525 [Pleionea sp. HL-JVS1]
MTSELIVTKRRGATWYILWALVFLAVVIAVFFIGRADSRQARLELEEERSVLLRQVEEYEERIGELEQTNIVLQSAAQVDAQASEEIMDTISRLQQTIDELETELSFYRGIMAPELDLKGLQIASLTLKPLQTTDKVSFQLALTQVKTHTIFLKGDTKITVSGTLNGEAKTYDITELSELSDSDLRFTFKYFQNLSGEFSLPNGFTPRKVVVLAKTSGRNAQEVTREFDWTI